jgi:hypothetical protein
MVLEEAVAPDERGFARMAAGVAGFALEVDAREILRAGRGSHEVAFARQVAMYLCHVAFEFSLARVARAFCRDNSTVAHACHRVEDRRDDAHFDQWISALERVLRDTQRKPQPERAQP